MRTSDASHKTRGVSRLHLLNEGSPSEESQVVLVRVVEAQGSGRNRKVRRRYTTTSLVVGLVAADWSRYSLLVPPLKP